MNALWKSLVAVDPMDLKLLQQLGEAQGTLLKLTRSSGGAARALSNYGLSYGLTLAAAANANGAGGIFEHVAQLALLALVRLG